MPVLCDSQIRELGVVEPFAEAQKRPGKVSFGVSSYGLSLSLPGGSAEDLVLGSDTKRNERRKLDHLVAMEALAAEPDQLPCHYFWADAITGQGYPEVFRVTVSNSLIYSKAAKWIKDNGFKHVAVIGENSDWGLGVIRVFKDNLNKAGVKVTSFSAERTVTDFTPQLLQLKNATPPVDFLVDGFTGAGELLMIKQAYELGIAPSANCALLGAGMDTLYPGFWDTVGDAGVYVLSNPAGLPGLPKTETSEKFKKVFMARHNREPDAVAMEGYDSVMLIAEAVKLSNSTKGEDLIEALENKVNWVGTRGTVKFSTDKTPDWAYHMWMDVPVFIIQYTELNQDPSKAAILWPEQHATVKGLLRPAK